MPRVNGYCDPAFRAVAAAFEDSFAADRDQGAAIAVVIDGHTVVELWGGSADRDGVLPWERDTIVNVFSATKGMTALCAHLLAERGVLNLEAPVSTYWPEFATGGKSKVTVAQLLDHSAGIPAVRDILPVGTLYDWAAMTGTLAAEEPWWEPGARHGYHAVTFGFLVGEVIRRASGHTVRSLVRDEIAMPLGVDLHIGLPEALAGRAAYLPPIEPPPATQAAHPISQAMANPNGSIVARAFANPPDLTEPGLVNTARWRRAEVPASNGHANAHALALMYAALTIGGSGSVRLLNPARVAAAAAERVRGIDAVLGAPTRFSLGFMLPNELRPFALGPRAFGHPGAGGALGFADLDAHLGFGYTPSRTVATLAGPDARWPPLVSAVYESL